VASGCPTNAKKRKGRGQINTLRAISPAANAAKNIMKEFRIFPPPPGQTDLFGNPAFACVVPTPLPAPAEPETPAAATATGHSSTKNATAQKPKAKAPAGHKKPKEKTSGPVAQPVIRRAPATSTPSVRASARDVQKKCRAAKKLGGLCRMEIWVPSTVKMAYEDAAEGRNVTMYALAAEVLAGALGTPKRPKIGRAE
jgi:hypothetical protein